jgi:hypothetical protein
MSSLAPIVPAAHHVSPAPYAWQGDLALCEVLLTSHLLPGGIKCAADALIILMTGRELGLGPMQSLRSIYVVEGRPTLSADLIAALVRRSGKCGELRCLETSATRAVFAGRRVEETEPTSLTFTIEDARRANLAGRKNWTAYPAAMLRARAQAALCRLLFPDVVAGIYDPDELGAEERPSAAVLALEASHPAALPAALPVAAIESPRPAGAAVVDELPFRPVSDTAPSSARPSPSRAPASSAGRKMLEKIEQVATLEALESLLEEIQALEKRERDELREPFRERRVALWKESLAPRAGAVAIEQIEPATAASVSETAGSSADVEPQVPAPALAAPDPIDAEEEPTADSAA